MAHHRLVVARSLTRALLLLAVVAAPLPAQELAVTRVRLDSLADLNALARAGYEVSGVRDEAGALYALVVATVEQRVALAGAGRAPVVVAAAAPGRTTSVNFRDFAAVQAILDSLVAAGRPISVDTIGTTFEGRPVLVAKLGPPDDAPERPNVLYLGAHHAREWISTEMALAVLRYLLDSLPNEPGGAALLAARDVWVAPVVNPDGYQYAFDVERFWRKNRRPNADGSFGVDLNRNYPLFWGYDEAGSSSSTLTETYRGPAPGSEAEVQAMMAFHAAHPPAASISYHSYSDLILFPYGFVAGRFAADPGFVLLSGTPLAPAIQDGLPETARPLYHPGPGWRLYVTNGEYTEWAYRTYGTLAFTVELTSGCCQAGAGYGFDFPDDAAAIAQVARDNLPFARAVLAGAGGGGAVAVASLESAWPELRVIAAPGPATRDGEAVVGLERRPVVLTSDSLDRGAAAWRWRGQLGTDAPREVTVPDLGLRVGLAVTEGAERAASGWTGFARDSGDAVEGLRAWRGFSDTLVSPELGLTAVTNPALVFWTQHGGSLFLPDRYGIVSYSLDGGSTWVPIARVEGSGPTWYPIRAALPNVQRLRLRFVARQMTWRVDAIQLVGTPVGPPTLDIAVDGVGISENPIRSGLLHVTWQGQDGEARVSVFSVAGRLVFRAVVPAASGLLTWEVTNRAGQAVSDGVYVLVLEVGGAVYRKKLFVARAQ